MAEFNCKNLISLKIDMLSFFFAACAIRPKTLPAPERKEKKKLQRLVFNPSDFEDSPPKRSKLGQSKRSIAYKAKSSAAVNSRKTTNMTANWNYDKDKPKLVTEELLQAKSGKKFFMPGKPKNNVVKVDKNKENKVLSLKKRSSQKEKLKNWFHHPMESKKLDFSTNTPDWTVAEVNPKKKMAVSPTSDLSPTECEFLEIEKDLKMKDATTLNSDASGWVVEVQNILEQDRAEIFKFQNKVEKLVDEFITAQDLRNEKIMMLLKAAKNKSKTNDSVTPLKDITSKANRKSPSNSDGKVLWKPKNAPEDKVMDKAINLYNSMRNISKSILATATPKLNRSSLQTPESLKKSAGVSISKIIQKQCLMLHETPYKH